tara:strand:- start:458 stop:637 length:180 start_codon:yes stop_codon:yes gene_type:complete
MVPILLLLLLSSPFPFERFPSLVFSADFLVVVLLLVVLLVPPAQVLRVTLLYRVAHQQQ